MSHGPYAHDKERATKYFVPQPIPPELFIQDSLCFFFGFLLVVLLAITALPSTVAANSDNLKSVAMTGIVPLFASLVALLYDRVNKKGKFNRLVKDAYPRATDLEIDRWMMGAFQFEWATTQNELQDMTQAPMELACWSIFAGKDSMSIRSPEDGKHRFSSYVFEFLFLAGDSVNMCQVRYSVTNNNATKATFRFALHDVTGFTDPPHQNVILTIDGRPKSFCVKAVQMNVPGLAAPINITLDATASIGREHGIISVSENMCLASETLRRAWAKAKRIS